MRVPLQAFTIFSLAIDPSDSETLYVAGAVDYYTHQILKSSDGGATWQAVHYPFFSGPYDSDGFLQIQPSSLAVWAIESCAARCFGASLIRSDDGGVIWSNVGRSDITNIYNYSINSYALDPANENGVYLLDSEGLFKSSDKGATWSKIGAGPGVGRDSVLVVDVFNPAVLYAGGEPIFVDGVSGFSRSADGGSTWETTLDRPISAIVADPRRAGTVWVGTAENIFVSVDFGVTWSTATPALDVGIVSLSLAGSDLYAGTAVGVYELTTILVNAVPSGPPLLIHGPRRLDGVLNPQD
jgi:hypothetical protein